MLEHVGHWNHKTFFEVAKRCLVPDGIFLVHAIAKNHENMPRSRLLNHQSSSHIFPILY